MLMVFACSSIHACLNNGHHLVVYEVKSHIFSVIFASFHALSTLHHRVQTLIQSMIIEDNEKPIRKVARKIHFNT